MFPYLILVVNLVGCNRYDDSQPARVYVYLSRGLNIVNAVGLGYIVVAAPLFRRERGGALRPPLPRRGWSQLLPCTLAYCTPAC